MTNSSKEEWTEFLNKNKRKSNHDLLRLAFDLSQIVKQQYIETTGALRILDALMRQVIDVVEKYPDVKKEVSKVFSDYGARKDVVEVRRKVTEQQFLLINKYAQMLHKAKIRESQSLGGSRTKYSEQRGIFAECAEEGQKHGLRRVDIIKDFRNICEQKGLSIPQDVTINNWWNQEKKDVVKKSL